MTATVLGGALSLVVSACGGDDNDAEQQPRTTTTEADPTTTTLNPEEAARNEVITAREAADEAEIEALAPPANPDLPALTETHTGLMLDRMIQTANGLREAGIASRLPEDTQHRLEVESIRFDEVDGAEVAFLEVCIVEDAERIDPATDRVLQTGVVTFKSSEAMKKEGEVWKLAERRQDSVDEGVTGCAVD